VPQPPANLYIFSYPNINADIQGRIRAGFLRHGSHGEGGSGRQYTRDYTKRRSAI